MRVISIRQPWATLIALNLKPVENRNWATRYRGPVLLHASAKDESNDPEVIAFCLERGVDISKMTFQTGGIIGRTMLHDCVDGRSASRLTPFQKTWFEGRYGLLMKDGSRVSFVSCKGRLGLYPPDTDLLAKTKLILFGV